MKDNNPSYRREAGFSLLELLISLVIFLVVIASLYAVMVSARNTKSLAVEKSSLNKGERVALNLMSRDTYNAGFGYPLTVTTILPNARLGPLLGVPNDPDNTRDTVAPVIAGNDLYVNNLNPDTTVRTDQVTFLFKDSAFNLVGAPGEEVSQPLSANSATTVSNIDELTLKVGSTNAPVRVNDLMLVTGSSGAALAVVTGKKSTNILQFANGDLLNFNKTTTGPVRSQVYPASLIRVRMVSYFVSADGILTRREYVNAPPPALKWVDTPLVFDVQNFQIEYVMDDGTINENPAAGPDNIPGTPDDVPSNLLNVRQIRYRIGVRSRERLAEGMSLEQTMTTTVSTRNLGYDAN